MLFTSMMTCHKKYGKSEENIHDITFDTSHFPCVCAHMSGDWPNETGGGRGHAPSENKYL